MAKPNFTLPNKPAIKSGSILSYNYTDDFTFVPAPLTFNRDSAATRVNEKGLIEDVGYFGPELVQNGDFSQIGSELITNGDFSVSGVVNTSSYTLGWYSPDSNINITNNELVITNGASVGGRAYATDGVNSINVVISGKFYKLVYTITENNDNATMLYHTGGAYVSAPNTVGTHTIYYKAAGTIFILKNNTTNTTVKIDNVSVKEVGQNWTFVGTASISDGKATINSPSGELAEIYQSSVLTIGNKYKLECTLDKTSGDTQFVNGGTFILDNGSNTIEFIATDTRVYFKRGAGSVISSIDNVSVIEVLGDKPRIDYSDSLTEPSLLLEPQSTNLVTFSENFNKWSSSPQLTDVSSNQIISPNGVLNATKLQPTQVSGIHVLSFTVASSAVKTYSVFAKQNGYKRFRINTGASGNGFASFDLNTGSVVSTGGTYYSSSNIKDYGNGWYRCSITFLANAPASFTIAIEDNAGQVSFAGDGVSSIYAWGAQVEQLPYATSYIPTAGSTATRLGETANNAGDVNVFNSEEGVLYAEVAALDNDSTYRLMSISDGTFTNRITLGYNNSSNQLLVQVHSSGISQVDFRYSISDITLYNKIALLYKSNEVTIWVNGVKGTSDTIASMPIGLSEFNLNYTYGLPLYAKVKDVKVFNKALTDRELEILTIQ